MVKTPKILPLIYPHFEWEVKTDEKKIFLTFDDGPIPEITDFVLETLAEFNARATFFSIGDNIRKHPEVFQKVIARGHSIGNHTFNHLNGWKTDNNEIYWDNIRQCQEYIDQYYSRDRKKLFRPPYGRVKRRQAAPLLDDYRIIMWSVLTKDYNAELNEQTCLSKSIRAAGSGSIVLFHDSLKASKNLFYVLQRFLSEFAGRGFVFEGID
ncbi:polysaccharide deacetylase family protein [Emticicia sp. CRIBPO]|uniref:polysaccharide deacetylase family protein n=1 Tax=Emticicia sp. CRIBPO TaxID=2683258 RepID=UPI001411E8ED|nr:polysaccharide deacetylase family protein [Emticicia sp. CRIBPO]NBA85858.1 polysaccharide deacetylase family protein [Emticicia sp. CRIBPO]